MKKPANSGKEWTVEEIKKLRELAKGNTPTRVIGIKLQRTPAAIYKIASDNNISLEPHNRSPYGTKKK